MSDIKNDILKREIDHKNVTTVSSTATLDTVSDLRIESPIVEENAHGQGVLVKEQPVTTQQQQNVENPV